MSATSVQLEPSNSSVFPVKGGCPAKARAAVVIPVPPIPHRAVLTLATSVHEDPSNSSTLAVVGLVLL